MRVSVLALLALGLVSAEAKLSPKNIFGVNPFVPMNPKHRHSHAFAALRAKHAEGVFSSKGGPRIPAGTMEVARKLTTMAISNECQAAAVSIATKTGCDDALDMDKQMASTKRETALCGANGCIAAFRKLYKACKGDFAELDKDGNFRKGAMIVSAMEHLCPASGTSGDGCFGALASYESNIEALEKVDGTDAQVQAAIGRVCGDACTNKIQKLWLMATETLGDREAVEEAQAHIRGREVVCTKDGGSGRYCYPDVHKYFEDDNNEDLLPKDICPKPCARKAFLKFVQAFGNKQLRNDFFAYFKFMCIKSDGEYCLTKFMTTFDDDDDDNDNDKCSGNDAAMAKCVADVAATDACTDAYKPDSNEVNPAMSCACANAIVECEKAAISTECLQGFQTGCKDVLTTCSDACNAFPADAASSSSSSSDPCSGLQDGQCPADCKTEVDKVVDSMGCCISAMVQNLEGISTTGELKGIHEISKMFKGANEACSLGYKWTKEESCQKLGKVTGKLGVNGVSKADVDKNKDKFYTSVGKDISDNIGAAATVTGHEETGAASASASGRKVRGLQTGVAFDYSVDVEDGTAADALKSEIKNEVDSGDMELTNTNAEVAKVNPGAEATVSKEASSVETVKVTPTPDPNASPASSSASTVTASIFAVLLGVAAALL